MLGLHHRGNAMMAILSEYWVCKGVPDCCADATSRLRPDNNWTCLTVGNVDTRTLPVSSHIPIISCETGAKWMTSRQQHMQGNLVVLGCKATTPGSGRSARHQTHTGTASQTQLGARSAAQAYILANTNFISIAVFETADTLLRFTLSYSTVMVEGCCRSQHSSVSVKAHRYFRCTDGVMHVPAHSIAIQTY